MQPRTEVTYAVYRAAYPASRPNTRNRPTRSCEPNVVRCRSMASMARVMAVENPIQYSVFCTSLSIVITRAMDAIERDGGGEPDTILRVLHVVIHRLRNRDH